MGQFEVQAGTSETKQHDYAHRDIENLIQSVQFYTWIAPHLWLEYVHKSLLLVSE